MALGAFGAHGLRGQIEDRLFIAFDTAVSYQLSQALALLLVGVLTLMWGERSSLLVSGFGFMIGILLFSGSLYLLALGGAGILPIGPVRFLGPITPIGGLALMVGWCGLIWAAIMSAKHA